MANNIKVSDIKGTEVKGINFDYWGGIEGFLASTSGGGGGYTAQQLRRVVPWLAKATDMTANAIASLPFEIINSSGTVVDSSSDWKNNFGGLPSPDLLLHKLAASLCLGQAYLFPTFTKRLVVSLQYFAPQTITPNITVEGLQWFDRSTERGKVERYYPIDSEVEPPLMYFWLPDADVEIGPALSYPAGAALLSAKLLFSFDDTIQTYSERGFVPATLLSAKGMPGPAEREKAENWWNRFLRGWTKEAAKIVNAEAMTVNRIGSGMDELKGAYSEMTKQAIENIGTAYGIPAALFMSDMAYATEANAMIKVWYQTSVFVKIYNTIQNTFNDQLLERYGLKWVFRPETIDAFQEEESSRASAFKVYVDAGIKKSIAAQMVGLELPSGIEYDDLDDKEPEPEPIIQRVVAQPEARPEPEEPEEDPEEKSIVLTAAYIKELDLWRQIAERNERKGKGRAADFECKVIPRHLADEIRTKLQSGIDIAKAFEIGNSEIQKQPIDNEGLKMLADAINRSMETPEVKTPSIVINGAPINYTMPQQDQPNIVVNVPEQAAPVVNISPAEVKVTNEVNPTPVTIENTVNVPEEGKTELKVKRDNKGVITGMTKE